MTKATVATFYHVYFLF